MAYCILIFGSSAVGKTTICRKLFRILGERNFYAAIQGDFFAHMIYGCVYTPDQLILKYRNISVVFQNIIACGYSVIFDDFVRRQEDADLIRRIALDSGTKLIPIRLSASTEILQKRNRARDYWDWIDDEKVKIYPSVADAVSFPGEFLIDTTSLTVEQTLQSIVDYLQTRGVYNPAGVTVVSKSFTPLKS
ncbi:MAG: AAA family ATPase [bacterium]|nr:AAA family ATPase [bacterium]